MRQKYLLCTAKLFGEECKAKCVVERCLKKGNIKVRFVSQHLFNHC